MHTSVIILSWNGKSYLSDCLTSLATQTRPADQIIVVDNGSMDGSADFVERNFPHAQLIRNTRNLGFAGGSNIGLRATRGDVIVLLNQDTQVRPDWLQQLVDAMLADPSIGIAGCKIFYPDGKLQHGGAAVISARADTTHLGWHEPDHGQCDMPFDADFVTGAALAITRPALESIGLLDEGFTPAYYEDVDWCYRARAAGYRVCYVPTAVVVHHESPHLANLDPTESAEFKHVYQRNRVRFVFKHWPIEKIKAEFLPAELAWLHSIGPGDEQLLLTMRRAYLDDLLALAEITRWRPEMGWMDDAGDLAAALVRLREACATSRLWTRPGTPATVAEREELLSHLHANWALKEQPFHSDALLIGSAIVRLREAFNSISTRWYALPLVQQQTEFNAQVVTMLAALESAIATSLILPDVRNLDTAELVQELSTLAERLQAIERRLNPDQR